MFERFTDQARQVIVLAQEEARRLDHNYIGTEHLLLGVLAEDEGIGARALAAHSISLEVVRQRVVEIIGPIGSPPEAHMPFTPRAKAVMELSLRQSLRLGHGHIGTEHLLLALIAEGEGVATQILLQRGVDIEELRTEVLAMAPEGEPSVRFSMRERSPAPSLATPAGRQLGRSAAQAVTPGLSALLFVTVALAAAVIDRPPTTLGRWALAVLGGGLLAIGASAAAPMLRHRRSSTSGSASTSVPPLLFNAGMMLFAAAAGLLILDGLLA